MAEQKATFERFGCESTETYEPPEFSALAADADLLAVYVQSGDRKALELLIFRYAPMVAGVCRSTVADNALAEDAFQATFLVLLKSAHRIRKHASLGAWLHGVAYRTACRARKKWRDELKHTTIENAEPNLVVEADPLARIARDMELEILDEELQSLPQSLRYPLVEHFLLGHTASQIAERMELTQAAVEGRIRRGKRRLRDRLALRGVGLSVAVAAATWFQRQVSAAEGTPWIVGLWDHLPIDDVGNVGEGTYSHEPLVSSLVKQELAMSGPTAIKIALSTLVVVYLGIASLGWQAPHQQGETQSTDASNSVTIESLPEQSELTILPQMIQATGLGGAGSQGLSAVSGRPPMRGPAQAPVKYEAWEQAVGPQPSWLVNGLQSNGQVEAYRKHLSRTLDLDFNGTPLNTTLAQLSDQLKIQFFIDEQELDSLGVAVDSPVTLNLADVTLRQALKLILHPLKLTYVVNENWIKITSKDAAESDPRIAYYELSHVLPDASHVPALMMSIEQHIDPDNWMNAGGESTMTNMGSLLIVSAPEESHEKIESLLSRMSAVSRKNLSASPTLLDPYPQWAASQLAAPTAPGEGSTKGDSTKAPAVAPSRPEKK